jgi:hypothetical protein
MAMNRKRAELLFHVSTFADFLTYPAQLIASIFGFWRLGLWRGFVACLGIGVGTTLFRVLLGIAFARWTGATDATFFD